MFGETTFHPVFSFERTQFNLFDASSVSFSAAWERKLWKPLNLSGALMYSIERIQQFNAASAIDNQTLRIGALTPSLFVDFRDNSLAPTSGFFSSASFEWANPSLGSRTDPFPIGYTRFQARMDGYVPLARDVIWYLSFRTGLERNTETAPSTASLDDRCQYQIPIYKQFALGGAGSLRGFSEQELNVQNMAILGTASYVNYRTQIDLPFAGPLRFGPFLDAANLLVDKFSFGMLRYGTGVGFHYQSPVGSVNFDWGFKVNQRPGEDPFRFYFSIGSI
jgi:outer membrane protein insertion porin family